MSMICSVLAIDADALDKLRQDEELVLGVAGLAYTRLLDESYESLISTLPEAQQIAARARRIESEAEMLKRLPAEYAEEIAQTRALRDRAEATINVDPAISLEKSWDALHHLFEPAGGSMFAGTTIGPDQGYGPALLRTPAEVSAFSVFLNGDEHVKRADMAWLRQQMPYAWPEPGDTSVSDEELREGLSHYFEALRAYVSNAAKRGHALLVWIS